MTREELWTAIVDMRQKNPVKEGLLKEKQIYSRNIVVQSIDFLIKRKTK